MEACGGVLVRGRENGKSGEAVCRIPPSLFEPFVKRRKNDGAEDRGKEWP
jgi:hypothetical protein